MSLLYDVKVSKLACINIFLKRIRADGYLQTVELEGDYRFSDNYFVMLKGEIKTVKCEKLSNAKSTVKVNAYTIK